MAKEKETENGNKKSAKKGPNTPMIAALLVILVLSGVIVWLLTQGPDAAGEPEEGPARGVVVNQDNAVQVLDEMLSREPVRAGNYQVSMTTEWHFPNSSSESQDAYVANPEGNTNAVYFDVEMEETGEILYQSPVLPLGTYLQGITLEKELSAGTYPAVAVYHLVDDNQKTISTVRVSISIIVEN